ncbi:Activator of Hsp90 ATPase 1 family protein [Gordonia bronchialis DSM 43247]|uniref:Activator of Hsp90 ATPase 1 family protein n=1 Tax=Gordonia bronchialis (strain ATCC 25592 / DSM 43247 / BCRC 13721 / JCM 3198 / KCTC 3076 / NBRC 16047 / NCTC 10667) TaxID=526226 RepID=D0LF41_GORB4|nr:SRPBCC family protein [Gordonia bronchialis]ACY22736.1 Activator of Hsp90 ATPase 1 family protein [Gordonia bronchialis DSM 43247]MCC3325518.1 SRPBCC family protein [Gordonia bronchialis]QGS23809.1 polyketide cyclase [Gordonia bronchialis]UAK40015.1 SRPBCC family protein [Gordonia bronchialis]STQ65679.1 Activator of Hsp90 ATPase homolog 1-like protein [Gordonia bronchialis]
MSTPNGTHGTISGRDAMRIVRGYAAPIDVVWAAITESDRLARWIGFFTGDPAEGHVQFTMNAEGEENMTPNRYDIRRCEPPRLLEIVTTDDYGSWHLLAELEESQGVTTLTFAQILDDEDPSVIENSGPGWEYYLDRLGATLTGADPDAVNFDDYYPAQREYYRALSARITGETTPPDSH